MDGSQLDRMARALGSGATRRGAVSLLFAVAGAHLAAAAGLAHWKPPHHRVTICHKPGKSGGITVTINRWALAAHLRHGDYRGPCCPKGHAPCNGHCCPPPPPRQGGPAVCCDDGSCGCAGECCAGLCFLDNLGSAEAVKEFCCTEPEFEVCKIDDKAETCCPAGDNCSCAESGGIAGSYRRPGR
jgi:hypothetical protein